MNEINSTKMSNMKTGDEALISKIAFDDKNSNKVLKKKKVDLKSIKERNSRMENSI